MKKLPLYGLLMMLTVLCVLTQSCTHQREQPLFTALASDVSGIDFDNAIHENDSAHSFINEFGYMGGGVGIGDFNNDGLKDIFFTGNQVSCRLYINQGNNRFKDVTATAGVTTQDWATGVSIADVNHDGYDDIYVCVFGKNLLQRAKNLLFINQHNLTFKESAGEYGLADTGYSTQAVFVDYDRDGLLDMYLANYRLNGPNANSLFPRDNSGRSPANDQLYHNDGYADSVGHDVFTNVSMAAGIKEDGYGLGVVASDFNGDGWPDIYVANDFVSNDELWLNNQHGGFYNGISKALRHQSYSSMGADAADLNNDGLPDIVTLDMLPEYNQRKKQTFFFMNYDRYQSERALGYEPEFARNMLQLNLGAKDSIPLFSEIGQLAGIAETDWSWSVLLADFDNDGWKDIHITNGIGRDFINGDFLEFGNSAFTATGSPETQRQKVRNELSALAPVKLGNYLYLNQHNYSFSNTSAAAGVDKPSLSNGAAYADLDNDGDLDLVTNNINGPAFVLINNSRQVNTGGTHYLKLKLHGDSHNKKGFGATITVYCKGQLQMQEQNPVRGYFSSVDADLVFGLANHTMADSLVITWPNQRQQRLHVIPADTTLTLVQAQASTLPQPDKHPTQVFFEDVTATTGIDYAHHDDIFNDFALQRLLPQKYSQMGPFIATADIDANGTTDLFVGNGINFSGKLIRQQANGTFTATVITDSIKMEDDQDCILFDADGDGDPDLLVTGGDVQYTANSEHYHPRLYLNDSKGNFSLRSDAIPASVATIAGCVRAADYDNDGDADLFIGGRVANAYPASPNSYILQNNKGKFVDVTAAVCPALQKAGMVAAAVWTDFDNDNQTDLVIGGEWMPIRFFKNIQGRLQEVTASTGLPNMNGMWRSLVAADIDNDGDADLVAGNLGLNCIYKADSATPMQLFAADIDGNGTTDPVLFYYIKVKDGTRELYPAIGRAQLAEQIPAIKKKFLKYQDYAKARLDDIFSSKAKENMQTLSCYETSSCWLENKGNGKFVRHMLPVEAQFAPVNAILATDIDEDGWIDLVLAGNEYQADVMTGRYDASYGLMLKGKSDKSFQALAPLKSGLVLQGDIKSMALVSSVKGPLLVAAANNNRLQVFRIHTPGK